MSKIVELIMTQERMGIGKDDDPVRMINQLFTKEGELVAEDYDEYEKQNKGAFCDISKIKI